MKAWTENTVVVKSPGREISSERIEPPQKKKNKNDCRLITKRQAFFFCFVFLSPDGPFTHDPNLFYPGFTRLPKLVR